MGQSWTPRSVGPLGKDSDQVWLAIASSSDGTKLAAAGKHGINGDSGLWTSTDSGLSWKESSTGVPTFRAITSSSDGEKLAAATLTRVHGIPSSIWVSWDSGVSWSMSMVGLEPASQEQQYWRAITSSSDGTKLAAASSTGYEYPYNPENPSDAGAGGNIWTSSGRGHVDGAMWTERSVGEKKHWRAIASSSDGTKLTAVARFSDIWTSTDSGKSWSVPYQ